MVVGPRPLPVRRVVVSTLLPSLVKDPSRVTPSGPAERLMVPVPPSEPLSVVVPSPDSKRPELVIVRPSAVVYLPEVSQPPSLARRVKVPSPPRLVEISARPESSSNCRDMSTSPLGPDRVESISHSLSSAS